MTQSNPRSINQKPKRLKPHNSKALDFLISALSEGNPFMDIARFSDWFETRRNAHKFCIEEIPFRQLESWSFESSTGNLRHSSGKFFSIEGIWVETNTGPISQWSQPIINQPEIGILGILAKKFDGVLHFLMQAKMEPGNIGVVQLGPTVQATRSNYTLAHKGNTPPYLEYFLDKSDSTILLDSLQSEQGARFLSKRNRNIIIETTREVEVREDYCWLTLGQIHKLMKRDNTVNMDARSVLSCISFAAPELQNKNYPEMISFFQGLDNIDVIFSGPDDFHCRVIASAVNCDGALHDTNDIISWFTELKVHYELRVERIPLKFVKNWHITPTRIVHEKEKYFSIIAVAVQAGNREVSQWTQPLVKPQKSGLVAYIAKNINGVLHFLFQAKVEPGNFDIIEMAPTVQCITDSYEFDAPEERPAFLDYILNVSADQVRSSSLQSEEGGRFFQESNKYLIVEAEDEFPLEVPDNFIWITLGQVKEFVKYNNYVNVEARCLLSLLRFMP